MSDSILVCNHEAACRKTEEFYYWLLEQSLSGISFGERFSLGYWNQFKESDVFVTEISVSKVGMVNGAIHFHAMLVGSDKPFVFSLWAYYGGDVSDCHKFKDIRLSSLDELSFNDLLAFVILFFGIKKHLQLSLF